VGVLKLIEDNDRVHGGDEPPDAGAAVENVGNEGRKEVETHSALARQSGPFGLLALPLFGKLGSGQACFGRIVAADGRECDGFGGRCEDGEAAGQTYKVPMGLEDAPEEGVIRINLAAASLLSWNLLFMLDGLDDTRNCGSGEAEKKDVLAGEQVMFG